MPECPVGKGLAGYVAKPVVKNGKFFGQCGKYRNLVVLKCLHDDAVSVVFNAKFKPFTIYMENLVDNLP